MTTKEYINQLERDVQILRIREIAETNPTMKAAITKRKTSLSKLLTSVRSIWNRQFVTSEGVKMSYETTAFKDKQ